MRSEWPRWRKRLGTNTLETKQPPTDATGVPRGCRFTKNPFATVTSAMNRNRSGFGQPELATDPRFTTPIELVPIDTRGRGKGTIGNEDRALTRARRSTVWVAVCLWGCLALLSPARAQDKSVQVTEQELRNAALYKPEPEYPAVARQIRLAGEVELLVSVDPAGQVEKVTVTRGNTLLSGPCAQAIKKWRFAPFRTDGQATHAAGPIKFSFKM